MPRLEDKHAIRCKPGARPNKVFRRPHRRHAVLTATVCRALLWGHPRRFFFWRCTCLAPCSKDSICFHLCLPFLSKDSSVRSSLVGGLWWFELVEAVSWGRCQGPPHPIAKAGLANSLPAARVLISDVSRRHVTSCF